MAMKHANSFKVDAFRRRRNVFRWIAVASVAFLCVNCSREDVRVNTPQSSPVKEITTMQETANSTNTVATRLATNSPPTDDQSLRSTLLGIWRSTNSLPKERADAARKLIPAGAFMDFVVGLLGQEDSLDHNSGFYLGTTNVVDDWILQYKSPRGSVWVWFRGQPGLRPSVYRFSEVYSD